MVRVVGARESRGVGRTLAAREPEQVGFFQDSHANHQAVARLHTGDSKHTFCYVTMKTKIAASISVTSAAVIYNKCTLNDSYCLVTQNYNFDTTKVVNVI